MRVDGIIKLRAWPIDHYILNPPKATGVAILGGLMIQFRRIQIFLLSYFYSFNIVFEDKPPAVLTSS